MNGMRTVVFHRFYSLQYGATFGSLSGLIKPHSGYVKNEQSQKYGLVLMHLSMTDRRNQRHKGLLKQEWA